jgi:hypothetical protein
MPSCKETLNKEKEIGNPMLSLSRVEEAGKRKWPDFYQR